MQAPPWFLGTCALASIAGVVSGTTINTRPIQRAGIGSEEIQRPDIAFDPADTGQPEPALPDHYALRTPQGLVPVAALSTRGIYSQHRYGYREASYVPPPVPTYYPPAPYDAEPVPEPAQAEPAAAVDPPAQEDAVAQGEPRLIDVGAALAAR